MPYTLEQFSTDVHAKLKSDPTVAGQQEVLEFVTKALLDDEFIEKRLKADECRPRKVLYEDDDLGFCICGHVYENGMDKVWPHDHGAAWAIYGLADGDTEMTDWEVVKRGDGTSPTLVKPVRSYDLKPGDCHLYKVGDIHSPVISQGAKLVRVEGLNLDKYGRSNIKAA